MAATVVALALAAGGCGGDGADGSSSRPRVVTSFYPLQFVAERVAGDRAEVVSLAKPGAEAHDLELAPKDVAAVARADLVVYLAGFQPAVDEAVATQAQGSALDVTAAARLSLAAPEEGDGPGGPGGHSAGDGHDHGAADPHFWLDPTKLEMVTKAVAHELGLKDPAGAAAYMANADALITELTRLDKDFSAGLRHCHSRDLVTGHAAFGYLAARYDLKQVGIAGLTPDQEPDAAEMRTLIDHIAEHKVTTVYAETLVSPALAQTLARETGAKVAVLDPLEGLSETARGTDYVEVMRSNLATLRAGQGCT